MDVAELFHTFRLVSKPWQRITEEIDQDFESGVLAFNNGRDVSWDVVSAGEERCKLLKWVIFFVNITRSEAVPAATLPISSLLIFPKALRASVMVPSCTAVV